MALTVKFSRDMSLVRRQLTKIGDDLKDELDDGLQAIAERTVQRLRDTTPGTDLPRGWKVVPLPGTRATSLIGIVNVDPRANKPVRSSGRTLLEILEFGVSPFGSETGKYDIFPRSKDGKLAFFWKKLGINVTLRSVKHPGFKPYFFIRPAIAQAKTEQAALTRALAERVRKGLV